jgi:hypothetical protein
VRFAVYWQGNLLRIHPDEASAIVDRDDCLARRMDDVQERLPAGQACPCDALAFRGRPHTKDAHHREHIGLFEVLPYQPPKAFGV